MAIARYDVIRQSCRCISPWVPSAQDALARENNKLHEVDQFLDRHIWRWADQLLLSALEEEMARYRKGDRYLSEEEYREEQENSWIGFLFLLGAGLGGYFVSTWVSDIDLPKWLRFSAVILGGLIGGGVLGAIHKQIQFIIGFFILSGIIYLIGSWVWANV